MGSRAMIVPLVTLALAAPAAGSATTTGGTSPVRTTRVVVYLMRGTTLRPARRSVARTRAVAAAALRALLAGPTPAEAAAGVTTSVPRGTRLLGVALRHGVATVDLSGAYASRGGSASPRARLGQVVYTLTQFATVRSVRIALDGRPATAMSGGGLDLSRPQTRADYEAVTPPILVEAPTPGDVVAGPLRLRGTANVFEAALSYALTGPSGRVLARGTATATCGSGCRGTFDVRVPVHVAARTGATLAVYAVSPRDGSRAGEVRIPVRLDPARVR